MSNQQYALLDRERLPTVETWQAAVHASPFDLQLDPQTNIGTDAGFVPCTLYGAEVGVEIYYDDSPEFIAQFSEIAPGKNFCISFRWGGSESECAVAMILSYALANDFGAIISYEGEPPSSAEALLADTQAILGDCGFE